MYFSLVLFEILVIARWIIGVKQESLRRTPRIHACLRTKNSLRHVDELLMFHSRQGVTSYHVYDDSENDNAYFFQRYPSVSYVNVGGSRIPNENFYIWGCMVQAILAGGHDYVLNMDDDEFIFPTDASSIAAVLDRHEGKWFSSNWCVASPVLFFGTTQSSKTGLTTVDFINRDRDVVASHITDGRDPVFTRYANGHTTKHLKARIEKAIFKVPETLEGRIKLISMLGNGMRAGALIHGYSMGCRRQHALQVAHYTRSDADVRARTKTFWAGVHGLEKRFDTDLKTENYLRERNRTEFVDTRVHDIALLERELYFVFG